MADEQANTIAFIGLGVMGYPMVANLRRKIGSDKTIVVYDVNKDVCEKFQAAMGEEYGPVKVVANAAVAITAADTLFTVLPSEAALEAVYLDPQTGVLAGIRSLRSSSQPRTKTLIECGTLAVSSIKSVAEACSALPNINFLDAPISGGPMGSEAGTLTFMVGINDSTLFESIKTDFLVHMGTPDHIYLCGDVGAGTAFKLINNYISIISILSVSEAYNIAQRLGLDIKLLTDLLNSGSARCWITDTNNPVPGVHPNVPASNGYKGGYRIELAEKVLDLGKQLAESVGASTVLDKAALTVFKSAAEDERYRGKDARVVYKYLMEKE